MTKQARNPKHAAAPATSEKHLLEDEVVHVPKGSSRLRFLITLVLTIFVLLIFTVGDELMQTIGGKNRNNAQQVHLSWVHPTKGLRTISEIQFVDELRRQRDFDTLQMVSKNRIDEDQLALDLIDDELALEAGVDVPDKQLSDAILQGVPELRIQGYMSPEIYKLTCQSRRITPAVYEGVLRRKLRITRWQKILMAGAAPPAPADMETRWKLEHQQFAFDYIEQDHASLLPEAAAQLPDEAGLKTWYDGLNESAKRPKFFPEYDPEKFKVELVGFRVGGEDAAAGLLAKFPGPAELTDESREQRAKDYFNQVSSTRFRRDAPLPPGTPEAEDPATRDMYAYAEVAEQARKEAPVFYALKDWLAELKAKKTAKETIDLAALAAELGLHYDASTEALPTKDWEERAGLGGKTVAGNLSRTAQGELFADVMVEKSALVVANMLERIPAAPPPFEKVKEKAAEEWKKDKAGELAVAKLNAVRGTFPLTPVPPDPTAPSSYVKLDKATSDEAAFQAAAAAAGFTVKRRDWLSMGVSPEVDPDFKLPAHQFLVRTSRFIQLDTDEIDIPATDPSIQTSFLVRSHGKRDPPELKIEPGEVPRLRAIVTQQSFTKFMEQNMSPKAYVRRYDLRLMNSDEVPPPAGREKPAGEKAPQGT
jgi:hypothetical protein